jgi:hypothetical protein
VHSWLLVVGYLLYLQPARFLGDKQQETKDQQQERPGGEIGRRTVFRWQHPKGCAGSNPVPGTGLDFRQFLSELPFSFSSKSRVSAGILKKRP